MELWFWFISISKPTLNWLLAYYMKKKGANVISDHWETLHPVETFMYTYWHVNLRVRAKTHSFLRGKGKSNFEAKQTPPCFCFLALLLLEAFWYLPNVIFSPNNTSLLIGNILEILHLSVLDWSWERWVFWILYWRFLALALEVWLDWWWVSSCSSIQSPKKWRWAL